MSKQNRDPTHLPNPSNPTQGPADPTSVMVGGVSLPPETKNGRSIGRFKAEKPIFNRPNCILTGKLPFTINNSGSLVFSIQPVKIQPKLEEIRQDLVKIQPNLFEICRDLIEIQPDLAKIQPDLFKIHRDLVKIRSGLARSSGFRQNLTNFLTTRN